MKIRKILIPILSILLFSGCKPKPDSTIGGFQIGSDVLTDSLIDKNINKNQEVKPLDTTNHVKNVIGAKSLKETEIVQSYEEYGLLVVQNKQGYYGFYSLHGSKFIIPCNLVPDWLNYKVRSDSNLGYFIDYVYEGYHYYYDSLGNQIAKLSELESATILSHLIDKTVYLTVETSDDTLYYSYSGYGKLNEISSLPSSSTSPDYSYDDSTSDNDTDFPIGSEYNDVIDLSSVGLEGYYLANYNQLFTVFDRSNNKISSFTVPQNSNAVIINTSLYYQVKTVLPEDSQEYSYSQGNNKYSLFTYKIDFLTGTTTKVENIKAILMGCELYNSNNTQTKYSLLTLQPINEDRTVSYQRCYIIDQNFVLHDDITGKYISSFIKVENSYYNEVTNILYNSTFNEIAYLDDINPKLVENKYFYGTIDGKYGILDSSAVVVAEFIYDSISTIYKNGCVVGIRDGNYYRLDLINRSEELIGPVSSTSYRADIDLYITATDSYIKFSNTSQTLKSHYGSNIVNYTLKTLPMNVNNAKLYVAKITSTQYDYESKSDIYAYDFITLNIKEAPGLSSYTPQDSEKTATIYTGFSSSEDSRRVLKEGTNSHHSNNSHNYNYYSFTSTREGYYKFVLPDALSINNISDYSDVIHSNSYYTVGDKSNNVYYLYLEKETEYEFTIYSNTSYTNKLTYHTFEVSSNDGKDSSMPILYDEEYKTINFNSTYSYVYLSYNRDVSKTGYYTISTPNGVIASVSINGNSYTNIDDNKVYLTKGDKLMVRLSAGNIVKGNVTISYDTVQPTGSSPSVAYSYQTLGEDQTIEYNNEFGAYYKYYNNTSSQLILDLTTNISENTNVSVYDKNENLISINGVYPVPSYSSVYVRFENSEEEKPLEDSFNLNTLNSSGTIITNNLTNVTLTQKRILSLYSSSNYVYNLKIKSAQGNDKLTIIDSTGRQLYSKTIYSSDNTYQIALPSGTCYFIFTPGDTKYETNNCEVTLTQTNSYTALSAQTTTSLPTSTDTSISYNSYKYYAYRNNTDKVQYINVYNRSSSSYIYKYIYTNASTSYYNYFSSTTHSYNMSIQPGETIIIAMRNSSSSYTYAYHLGIYL